MTQSNSAAPERFGLIFTALFLIIGMFPLVHTQHGVRVWALVTALIIAIVTIITPRLLAPFESGWGKLGLLLHHITNPVVMAVIYWFAFVPTALVVKLMGKELLPIKRNPGLDSYWIIRAKPGISPESMSKQF